MAQSTLSKPSVRNQLADDFLGISPTPNGETNKHPAAEQQQAQSCAKTGNEDDGVFLVHGEAPAVTLPGSVVSPKKSEDCQCQRYVNRRKPFGIR
jgi:hypothetical protein